MITFFDTQSNSQTAGTGLSLCISFPKEISARSTERANPYVFQYAIFSGMGLDENMCGEIEYLKDWRTANSLT